MAWQTMANRYDNDPMRMLESPEAERLNLSDSIYAESNTSVSTSMHGLLEVIDNLTPCFIKFYHIFPCYKRKRRSNKVACSLKQRDPKKITLKHPALLFMVEDLRKSDFKPGHSNTFNHTSTLTRQESFFSELIEAVSNFGLSKATIQLSFNDMRKPFLEGVQHALNGGATEERKIENEFKDFSVELDTENGVLVIGQFSSRFLINVPTSGLSKTTIVSSAISVSVWQFSSLNSLKIELKRIQLENLVKKFSREDERPSLPFISL